MSSMICSLARTTAVTDNLAVTAASHLFEGRLRCDCIAVSAAERVSKLLQMSNVPSPRDHVVKIVLELLAIVVWAQSLHNAILQEFRRRGPLGEFVVENPRAQRVGFCFQPFDVSLETALATWHIKYTSSLDALRDTYSSASWLGQRFRQWQIYDSLPLALRGAVSPRLPILP